jgi:hypothetical protein
MVDQPALGGKRHIVEHAQIGEDRGDLERVGDAALDPLMGRQPGHVDALEQDRARARCDAAAHEADECRLAGAVRADNRPDFALVQREIDTVDGAQTAEGPAQAARLQQRAHGSHFSHLSRIVPSTPLGKNSTSTISATPTISR